MNAIMTIRKYAPAASLLVRFLW